MPWYDAPANYGMAGPAYGSGQYSPADDPFSTQSGRVAGASPWGAWSQAVDPANARADYTSWNQPTYQNAAYEPARSPGLQYDPQPNSGAGMYDSISGIFGAQSLQNNLDQAYKQSSAAFDKAHPGFLPDGTTAGGVFTVGGDWAKVDAWNPQVSAASAKYGVPGNLLKALMHLESGGENLGVNGAGAIGPMQVVGSIWNGLGYDLSDPAQNIMAGAAILRQDYDAYHDWAVGNGVEPWKAALYAYYAGTPYDLSAHDDPAAGGSGMSTGSYGGTIYADYQALEKRSGGSAVDSGGYQDGGAAPGAGTGTLTGNVVRMPPDRQTTYGTGEGEPPRTSLFWKITNGQGSISQGFGQTDFSTGSYGQGAYGYGTAYNVTGHNGVDLAVPHGTPVYAPIGGRVVMAGGTGYYNDSDEGNPAGSGELLIETANGDQYILGHMGPISVRVGDTVAGGQFVGPSGGENGGHVHIEVRQAGASTSSGYLGVDARDYFGGGASGGVSAPGTTPSSRPDSHPSAAVAQSGAAAWDDYLGGLIMGNGQSNLPAPPNAAGQWNDYLGGLVSGTRHVAPMAGN